MKKTIALLSLVALVGFGVAAQARLTPLQGTQHDPSLMARGSFETFGPSSAHLERNYFQAPATSRPVGHCTVAMFVFGKTRLAQACY